MSSKIEFIEYLKKNFMKSGNLNLKLVFICSGNIIRSAYAEFICRNFFNSNKNRKIDLKIESGACFYQNSSIIPFTKKWLKKAGISDVKINSHIPRLLSRFQLEFSGTDIFIGMTMEHIDYLKNLYPTKRSFLLKDIVLNKKEDILDPYFESKVENEIMNELNDILIKFCNIINEIA